MLIARYVATATDAGLARIVCGYTTVHGCLVRQGTRISVILGFNLITGIFTQANTVGLNALRLCCNDRVGPSKGTADFLTAEIGVDWVTGAIDARDLTETAILYFTAYRLACRRIRWRTAEFVALRI
jgi:hypothetical protein